MKAWRFHFHNLHDSREQYKYKLRAGRVGEMRAVENGGGRGVEKGKWEMMEAPRV